MSDHPASWWNEAYAGDPPWDVEEPQPAVVDLVDRGVLSGHVLEAGCGTGVDALAMAARGVQVTAMDVSGRAVRRARERVARAAAPGVDESGGDESAVALVVGECRSIPLAADAVDGVLDVGLFHAVDAGGRRAYADELAAVLRPGGTAAVLSFGPDAPADWGPSPVGADDVRAAFADGWRVADQRGAPYVTNGTTVPGHLAVLERR